jgi:hypothetical protein
MPSNANMKYYIQKQDIRNYSFRLSHQNPCSRKLPCKIVLLVLRVLTLIWRPKVTKTNRLCQKNLTNISFVLSKELTWLFRAKSCDMTTNCHCEVGLPNTLCQTMKKVLRVKCFKIYTEKVSVAVFLLLFLQLKGVSH